MYTSTITHDVGELRSFKISRDAGPTESCRLPARSDSPRIRPGRCGPWCGRYRRSRDYSHGNPRRVA